MVKFAGLVIHDFCCADRCAKNAKRLALYRSTATTTPVGATRGKELRKKIRCETRLVLVCIK